MTDLPVRLFDCDNHIYEPPDAVTRYLPEEFLDRAITPITLANGEQGLLAGGRLVTGLDHPIDMAHRPGALKEMLRQMRTGAPSDGYALEPLRPEYLERGPRLALMEEQGISSAILYPATMGTMAEHTVIDTRRSVVLPDSSDPIAIAAAMNPAMSSWVALRQRVTFQAGQSVLVLAATGNAGRMAIQVAQLFGADRIVAAARGAEPLPSGLRAFPRRVRPAGAPARVVP